MKAIMNSKEPSNKMDISKIQFGNQDISNEIEIVEYLEEPEKGQFIISLYSQLFSGNQIKIFIRDNKIILFITEVIDSSHFTTMYVSDWQNFYPQSYARMRNVSLLLPGDNFYLLRHFFVPEKFLLKIILGQPMEN